MNTIEHYLYVTPKNKHYDIPEKYKIIVNANANIFPDLDQITEQIWTDENNSSIIECKRLPYISKCNLLGIDFVSYSNFINKLRPTEMTENNNENAEPVILNFNTGASKSEASDEKAYRFKQLSSKYHSDIGTYFR